jgi:hypothetical protein
MSLALEEKFWRLVEFLRLRKRDYGLTFLTPNGQRVLSDLARFCRANETCFNADARLHAVAEGRREVWLRIQDHLTLTSEQLATLRVGDIFVPSGEEKDTP